MSRTVRRKQFKSFRNPKYIGQRRAIEQEGVELCRKRNRERSIQSKLISDWDDFKPAARPETWGKFW